MRKNIGKTGLLVLIVAISTVVMGIMLWNMQERLSLASYEDEMAQEAEQLPGLLEDASEETAQNKETFDAVYQSKAQSISFIATHDAGFKATDAKMAEYRQLLGVDNIMVVDEDGTVRAKATDTKANFSYARFNYLRECLTTGEPSPAVEIELPERDWLMRYYAARLDDHTMIVIEQSPAALRTLVDETGSVASVLRNISIGQGGYVLALSAQTYLIEYHPDEALVGADALDAGIDVSQLEDGNTAWFELDGEDIYGRVSLIGDTYYICAVPASEMAASRVITVAVILFAFFAVMAAVTLYGVFLLHDEERDGDRPHLKRLGALRYNPVIGKRACILSFVGLIAILGISFYMQTLFALSTQSVANKERAESIAETIDRVNERADDLTAQYDERYLSKARVAAYILDANPKLATKDNMQQLADALQVENVYLFDVNGDMVVSNAPYEHFTLSEDPADQSYAFRQLLQGVDEFVQEPMEDDMTGELRQYIGVATHDDKGYVDGFVQIGVRSTALEELLASVQIDHVLDGVRSGANGFAFAVNADDGTIAYYPNAQVQGKKATDVGLREDQLRGGYDDYITVNGKTYYASSIETSGYYVYVAGSEGELMAQRTPLTIATGAVAFVCLAAVFCVLSLEPDRPLGAVADTAPADGKNTRTFDIETPSGRRAHTESAASRWLNRSLDWDQMTPEQKLGFVMRLFVGIGVIAIFVSVVFKDQIFGSNTVFGYILNGGWERGFNIFAFTASIMTACVIFTASWVIQKVLHLLSGVLSARGETVCRLLVSLTKYGAILGALYWCLAAIGVDTATLLASAGLLTLAISFGAKDLVTDLLSGLFIIFEGEFRVGDTISVGGNTGTVMEIGIRTTKINDGNDNVIVLRNSAISNVVNRTKLDSFASVDVNIAVGEDLPHLENILKRELPNIAARQPMIIEGPFYRGIVNLTESTMTIRIMARCAERNRGALERNLKREMRLLLTRYEIAPYQQQYDHSEPINAESAKDVQERDEADEYVGDQSASLDRFSDSE